MAHLITLLADGFEEVEAITVIDLLRRADISVTTIALKKQDVNGAHGIVVQAETTIKHLPSSYDGIVLPGGATGTKNLVESPQVLELVRDAFNKGLLCAAICAAPSVFGKAGILQNIRATCYPGYEEQLGGARYIEAAVVRDKNVVTSRGVGTAIAFVLELITLATDEATSNRVGAQILYS
ncbi:MAG: DJ-1/PfpI family protein [Chitinispirillaceae bacterium]|nr:DJ-1/PfpI family protein [Chitinispirillaceae bacterium]